jgi:ubiquinone/menaquinone biosynthesis C-methylase UbiE
MDNTSQEKVVLDASHFDSKARQWDENPVFRDRAEKIANGIRAAVPLSKSMNALDYGSGSGLLSFPLKDELGHITLKDTSAGMLAVAEEKIAAQAVSNMSTRQMDLTAEPLPEESRENERYDLIYSSMTLHHIPDTDAILKTFHDLMNPGGWLCIADLDKEDGSFHGIEVDVHHGFDREELAEKVAKAGFAAARFDTVFEIVKETQDGSRAYPVFLMAARLVVCF